MVGIRNNPNEPKMYKHIILHGYNDVPFREFNEQKGYSAQFFDRVEGLLKKAHAFNVSSVYDIIHKVPANKANLFPPFPIFWIEGLDYPVRMLDGSLKPNTMGISYGMLIEIQKKKEGGYYFAISSFVKNKKNGVISGPVMIVCIQSDEYNNVIGMNGHTFIMAGRCFMPLSKNVFQADMASDCTSLVNFLGLINAKNISCPERKFELNNYNRRKLKATGARNRYHVLKIHKPGEKINKDPTTGENEGKMPLHVVRGHLRTYDEKGLFGKYFGTYFIPSHVRGDEKNGRVDKDYALSGQKRNS